MISGVASFIWNDWNVEHIAKHGVARSEAEYVIEHSVEPYPAWHGDGKWVVWGQTEAGRYLQVIFVVESDADINYSEIDLANYESGADALFVVHARPLTATEKRKIRK